MKSLRVKIFCFSCISVFLVFSKLSAVSWYSEYWQQFFLKMYESDRFGVRTFIRIETGNHWQNTRTILLSEQLAYKVNKDVALEMHYTYIHGHPLADPIWRWQNRLELEANRIFRLPCGRQMITRNRLEVRWREKAKPQPDLRFRQRTMLLIPLKTKTALKAFSAFNEVFYNISRGYFDQNRLCPCQLTFGLKDTIDLDLFLIFRILDEIDVLRKSVVFGTQLNF